PGLRAVAERLLDELALLESPLAGDEPDGLDAIRAACPQWPRARGGRPAGRERLHAAWLGRAAGCLLGKPVEKLPLEG
ncbi:ADP-ribosylglycohydrolase family protein, partial [Streptomyces sp. DT225]